MATKTAPLADIPMDEEFADMDKGQGVIHA